MASSQVYWRTGLTVSGNPATYADFLDQADEALYEFLTAADGVNDYFLALQTRLASAQLNVTWRRHRPEIQPVDGETSYPAVYIMSRQTATTYPETGTVVPRFRTDLTVWHQHADLVTARTTAQQIANILCAMLQQCWYAGNVSSSNWTNWYHNYRDMLEPETSEVELDYGDDAPVVYGVTVSIEWAHCEEISSGY